MLIIQQPPNWKLNGNFLGCSPHNEVQTQWAVLGIRPLLLLAERVLRWEREKGKGDGGLKEGTEGGFLSKGHRDKSVMPYSCLCWSSLLGQDPSEELVPCYWALNPRVTIWRSWCCPSPAFSWGQSYNILHVFQFLPLSVLDPFLWKAPTPRLPMPSKLYMLQVHWWPIPVFNQLQEHRLLTNRTAPPRSLHLENCAALLAEISNLPPHLPSCLFWLYCLLLTLCIVHHDCQDKTRTRGIFKGTNNSSVDPQAILQGHPRELAQRPSHLTQISGTLLKPGIEPSPSS